MTDSERIADLSKRLATSELDRLSAEAMARRLKARIATLEMMLRDRDAPVLERIPG